MPAVHEKNVLSFYILLICVMHEYIIWSFLKKELLTEL